MGVSLRRLSGWEPAVSTTFHYEGDRLIGSTTTREAEFDSEQVDLLLAFQALDADRGPHGQPMSEATDPDASTAVHGTFHYEANELPITDWAAVALAKAQTAYYERYPKASRDGHVWHVRRVDD